MPFTTVGVKPVSTMVPSGVSTVCGVVPSACSCASVKLLPPTVMLARPSPATMVTLPVLLSLVSTVLVRPLSSTSIWPAAPPLPSTAPIDGAPSVCPLIVIVNVVLLLSPSRSVIV